MAAETCVLGIPGPWTERVQVQSHCMEHGYLMAGLKSVIMDTRTNQSLPFFIEFCGADPRMRQAFEVAGAGRFSDDLLDEIAGHAMMLYLVSEAAPSVEVAHQMMDFSEYLLDAGGMAVKVETCGVAHTASQWRELSRLGMPRLAVYHGMTVRVSASDTGYSYSCGMHQFGLPDARVAELDPDATRLLDAFNKYLLLESPTLLDGQTFAEDETAPVYRMTMEKCHFEPDHLFHNPFGVWLLEQQPEEE